GLAGRRIGRERRPLDGHPDPLHPERLQHREGAVDGCSRLVDQVAVVLEHRFLVVVGSGERGSYGRQDRGGECGEQQPPAAGHFRLVVRAAWRAAIIALACAASCCAWTEWTFS